MIPRDVSAKINVKYSEIIDLQDPKGEKWVAKRSIWESGQVCIQGGWKKLCDSNKVKEDDTIILEFLPRTKQSCETINIKVQIINSDSVRSN